jgi:NAD+ synthase
MEAKDRIEYIRKWIIDYVESMDKPANCLVVGVSGGIDSSVVSTICAMTGMKTLVASMPISQRPEHHDLSIKHKNWLTTKYQNAYGVEIDLTHAYLAFENLMTDKKFTEALGFANSKARLRMMTLYQISASTSGLVVGTGNKIEDFGVGFFTKYGDGGVDISPIADCTKSQVWAMGKELGILEDIQVAEPTDGLWSDGRTDTDQLGMSYKEIEFLMERPNEPEYKKYLEIRKKNLHKMKSIPVCKFDGKASLETN